MRVERVKTGDLGTWPPEEMGTFRITFYTTDSGRWVSAFNVEKSHLETKSHVEVVAQVATENLPNDGSEYFASFSFSDGSGALLRVKIPEPAPVTFQVSRPDGRS